MKRKNSFPFISILFVFLVLLSCEVNDSKGKILYERNCANCHGTNAEGFKNLYPPIHEKSSVVSRIDLLPCMIKYGIHDEHPLNTKDYTLPMLSNEHLSDIDITNIRNYVVKAFLKKSDYRSLNEVKKELEQCAQIKK